MGDGDPVGRFVQQRGEHVVGAGGQAFRAEEQLRHGGAGAAPQVRAEVPEPAHAWRAWLAARPNPCEITLKQMSVSCDTLRQSP